MSASSGLPWRHLMALGLGQLRLAPATFWNMTPRELERALSGVFGEAIDHAPLARETLEALMRRFPDAASG